MIISSDYLREMRRQRYHRRRVSIFFAACSFVAIGFYFAYQLRDLILLPDLVIDQPADGVSVRGPEVAVEGSATPGIQLTVNGIAAYNEKNGRFHVELLLPAGLHTIHVVAENRFGRIRSLERQIVVEE